MLTATCYEHKHHIYSEARRQQLLSMIFDRFGSNDNEENSAKALTTNLTICAWVILSNHYHLLVHVGNFDVLSDLFRRIHGATARQWNLEENVTKRKIWYRWSDRAIRSERHYYTTVNYIHYNPVKHGVFTGIFKLMEGNGYEILGHNIQSGIMANIGMICNVRSQHFSAS